MDKRFVILNKLGSGTYGQVYRGIDLIDNSQVAIKISKGNGLTNQRNIIEARILESFKSVTSPYVDHVINMKTCYESDECVIIILELLSQDLYQFIRNNYLNTFDRISKFAKQMIEFLILMSEMNIIHGDIKPENILVHESGETIKFADFGLAHCYIAERKLDVIQTLNYRAPEVLLGYDYDNSVDTWSVGCILLECLLKKRFFYISDELGLMQNISRIIGTPGQEIIEHAPNRDKYFVYDLESNLWVVKGYNTPITPIGIEQFLKKYHNLPENNFEVLLLINLVEGMLKVEPSSRWSPEKCLKHPFVTNFLPLHISGSRFIISNPEFSNKIKYSGCDKSILREVNKLCNMMSIADDVKDASLSLFKKIKDKKTITRQNSLAVIISCLYVECHKRNVRRSYKEFSNISGISVGIIGRVQRTIKQLT